MSERTYYVICGDNCKFEGMTKEQIYDAIAEATGATPTGVDDAFITMIKEQNANANIKIWKGSQAQYNALATHNSNTLYFIDTNTITNVADLLARSAVSGKGSQVNPVYFDSNGVAYALPLFSASYSMTYSASSADKTVYMNRIGNVVYASISAVGAFPSANQSVSCGTIPQGYRPTDTVRVFYHGMTGNAFHNNSAGVWKIETNGDISSVTNSTDYIERTVSCTWITNDPVPNAG